jgi:hypothetical protein
MDYAVGNPPPPIGFYGVFTQSLEENFERFCRYQMSVLSTVYAFMLSVLQIGIHAKFCVTINKQPYDAVLMLNTLLFTKEFKS